MQAIPIRRALGVRSATDMGLERWAELEGLVMENPVITLLVRISHRDGADYEQA